MPTNRSTARPCLLRNVSTFVPHPVVSYSYWNSVSAWTWSATLLQSSTAAYSFGVSGPWWYGVGKPGHQVKHPTPAQFDLHDHNRRHHPTGHVRHDRRQSQDERQWCSYLLRGTIIACIPSWFGRLMLSIVIDRQGALWNRRASALHLLRLCVRYDRQRLFATYVSSSFPITSRF